MAQQTLIFFLQNYVNHWLGIATEFTKTDFFHQFSLLMIRIIASLPFFIPIPNEIFTAPAFYGGVNPIYIILAVGVGGFIGDVGLYFAGKKIFQRLTRGNNEKELESEHWLHRHGRIIYVVSPSMFIGIGDFIMLASGHEGVDLKKIAPFLFVGELIRGIWGIALLMGLFQLPNFLR